MNQHKSEWLFVDDSNEEAASFADTLSTTDHIRVIATQPLEAKAYLLNKKYRPAGVLMDVDLSNAPGMQGSGPGIAQDIRIMQRAGDVGDFPIVRFAGLENVKRNIGGDPASDDLFDWKLMKEELPRNGAEEICRRLKGLEDVYQALPKFRHADRSSFPDLVGLSGENWEKLGHPAFADRMLTSLQVATHVAAGVFFRSFLLSPGLLIDEMLLGIRLGVDVRECREAWACLLKDLPFAYRGAGCEGFPRWWARGLDEWWSLKSDSNSPLSSLEIKQRIDALGQMGIGGMVPIQMPQGSAGRKPWRFCSLSLERDTPVYVPLDPSESVRMTGATDLPPWVDPRYAALGPALQEQGNFQLNSADLSRLRLKYK